MILVIKLLTAETDTAHFDVFMTRDFPPVSVVCDNGQVFVTRWSSIKEALAYLIGRGCEIDAADGCQLVEDAIERKYGKK